MSKKEIRINIENIIKFAEIGIYIDQPVRTYSSGMIVRLAFAIIAHANADILIIDEALAVGDSYFTQKCMRFIQRFKRNGTLVFVSHDPNAVLSICNKGILLEKGRIKYMGAAKDALEVYANDGRSRQEDQKERIHTTKVIEQKNEKDVWEEEKKYTNKWKDYRTDIINASKYKNDIRILMHNEEEIQSESFGGYDAKILSTEIENMEIGKKLKNIITGGELIRLTITFEARKKIDNFIVGFILKNDKGLAILGDNTYNKIEANQVYKAIKGEVIKIEFVFTMPLLRAGQYSITSSVAEGDFEDHKILHWQNDCVILESQCTSIAAGLAGVPMQSIGIKRVKE